MSEEGDPKGAIDATLLKWQQGDCAVGPQSFVHRFHPGLALTPQSAEVDDGTNDLVELEFGGLAIVSQTCDVVRPIKERPLLSVCPLVETEHLEEVRKGRRPRFLYIPGVAEFNLVGDLDRTTTIEKALICTWTLTRGCRTDEEARRVSQAIGRKYSRIPFPDDFTEFCRGLQDRLKEKHGKESPEGDALRSLREIRVQAAPSWDASEVKLTFLFIRDEESAALDGTTWTKWYQKWMSLLPEKGRFRPVGQLTTLEDLTARAYVDSDPLDLDHLSGT